MKNLQITLTFAIAFFLISTTAMAQDWNLNSSGFLTTTNARVGIGLTNPDQKLHVSANNAYAQLKLQRTGNHAGSTYLGGSEYGLTVGRFINQNVDAGEYKIDFVVNRNGRVGIGTKSPAMPLHVNSSTPDKGLVVSAVGVSEKVYLQVAAGNYGYLQLGGQTKLRGNGKSSSFGGSVGIGTSSPKQRLSIQATRPRIALVDNANDAGVIEFHEETNQIRLQFWKSAGSQYNKTMMSLDGDSGGVGIGTDNVPSGYRFAVDGKAIVEELKVQLSQNWADYVFQDDYDLKSLEEVEQTIEERGHLHNIASAAEIEAAGGIEIGDITVNQQEKIEELFLHLIELNKEVKALRQEIKDLKSSK